MKWACPIVPILLAATAFGQNDVTVGDPTPARPNFVLILIDDMGWRDPGCYGNTFFETPAIDRIAREGMTFTDAYANAPNCAPTRACLMSGQYTPRHGVYTVGASTRGKSVNRKLIPTPNTTVLADEILTLPEVLAEAGYVCATMGKWHLGPDPTTQGFHINIGGNATGSPRGGYFSPYRNPQLPDGPDDEYLVDRLTDEAVAFLKEHRDRPFFLYLTHYAVHTPIQGKPELIEKYREKRGDAEEPHAGYAALVQSTDESVGRVLDALDELGLAENTIVIFTSDNGGHGRFTTMDPLRGSKGMLYEGGIREPLLVRWPGRIAAGSRSDVPVITVDFFPTMLELAGVEPPPDKILDGESLARVLLENGDLNRDAIYWHFPAYLEAYTRGQGTWRTTPAGAVRAGDFKLIEFFEDGRLELYNLKDDIGERNNLAQAMPELTRQLHEMLQRWRREHQTPALTSNPEYDAGG